MTISLDKLRDMASVEPLSGDPVVYERWQLATELLASRPIVEAAAEVAKAARTAPPGLTSALQDAVEKLVRAVEGKP